MIKKLFLIMLVFWNVECVFAKERKEVVYTKCDLCGDTTSYIKYPNSCYNWVMNKQFGQDLTTGWLFTCNDKNEPQKYCCKKCLARIIKGLWNYGVEDKK